MSTIRYILPPVIPASARRAPLDGPRIDQLRAAILGGTYLVDAGRIADRLIELERLLP